MTDCEIVIINAAEENSFEENLTRDVLEIITVFSTRHTVNDHIEIENYIKVKISSGLSS